ncbi:hypothetical protein HZH68_016140 [Vespula germanica]|uniref:Uncharacterized protein n=1 Tax=Vespula germanica TaxID=30212 RepID=A0A834J4C4_VESGE|nr:hypothetical protein HZH68_016140 [Vespula germanica]
MAIFSYNTSVHECHNIRHMRSSLIKELSEQLAKYQKSTKHNLNSSKDVAEYEACNLQMINNTIFIQLLQSSDYNIYITNEGNIYTHQLCQQLHTTGNFSLKTNALLSGAQVPRPAKGLNIATHKHMRRRGHPNIRRNYVIRLLYRH